MRFGLRSDFERRRRSKGSGRSNRAPVVALPLAVALVLWSSPALAHDPSAWGGLFRSRDDGVTWFLAGPGRFASAAIALAISPTDVDHLLLATDSGLLRSRNGGRDWVLEAPTGLVGAVFAVAFSADGAETLVATGTGVFRGSRENDWRRTPAPAGASPTRALVRGRDAGRVYLAGWRGLFVSDDWGDSWSDAASGLPDRPVTALVVAPGSPERVRAIVGGQIWERVDGAPTWTGLSTEIPALDALALDGNDPARLLAVGAGRMFRSDDRGASWRPLGAPLPEANTSVRGIAASGGVIVLATDRGLYRTVDGGARWQFVVDSLPAHIEAGPLVRDPVDPATLYAGFALTPYPERCRRRSSCSPWSSERSSGTRFARPIAGSSSTACRSRLTSRRRSPSLPTGPSGSRSSSPTRSASFVTAGSNGCRRARRTWSRWGSPSMAKATPGTLMRPRAQSRGSPRTAPSGRSRSRPRSSDSAGWRSVPTAPCGSPTERCRA